MFNFISFIRLLDQSIEQSDRSIAKVVPSTNKSRTNHNPTVNRHFFHLFSDWTRRSHWNTNTQWSWWPQGNCLKKLSFPIHMFWHTLCIDKMRVLLEHGVFSFMYLCVCDCLRFSLSLSLSLSLRLSLIFLFCYLLARCANITSVKRTTMFDANWLTDWLTN